MESDNFSDAYGYDNLGDSYNIIYVDEKTDTMGYYYFTEEYQQMVQRANEDIVTTLAWGLKGHDWELTDQGMATYPDGITAENELTACFNVTEQYKAGLAAGSVDYETTYEEFHNISIEMNINA